MHNNSIRSIDQYNISIEHKIMLPFSVIAAVTDSSSSPEIPIQVGQPYPTT